MGLFHNTCEALIDLSTGDALSGDALARAREAIFPIDPATGLHTAPLTGAEKVRALQEYGWGICGHSVSKRARVCSKCGSLAPKGWVKCPSCRKWISNESRYCPRCNHPLHPEERVDLAGGIWDREPGAFAQRIELSDVAGIKRSGLKIQAGTMAILLDAGKKVSILGPGRHSPEGLLRTINWFGSPPPRSLVMVDAGDCVFRMDFEKMRTAEEMEVSVIAEVTLRFDPGEADAFLVNVLKADRRLTAEEMCSWLVSEATLGVRNLCNESTLEDLVKDPDCRTRFEDSIGRSLKTLLKRSGLELVRVGYVDFQSAAYEKLRAQSGALEEKRREIEFLRKQRDLLNSDELEGLEADLAQKTAKLDLSWREHVVIADSERRELDAEELQRREAANRRQETEEYLAQLAQEAGLSGVDREKELSLARLVAQGEIDRKAAEDRLAALLQAHEADLAEARHASTVSRLKVDDKIYDAERQQDLAQRGMENQLKNLERIKAMEAKERAEVVAATKGLSPAEMLLVETDPERRRDLIELVRLQQQTGASSGAMLEEYKRMSRERQEHDDKMMQMMHDLASKAIEKGSTPVASAPAPAINIVK